MVIPILNDGFGLFKGLVYGRHDLLMWVKWYLLHLFIYLLIDIAFTGYVLTWGQMRYWAAVVITSLISSTVYFGKYLVW